MDYDNTQCDCCSHPLHHIVYRYCRNGGWITYLIRWKYSCHKIVSYSTTMLIVVVIMLFGIAVGYLVRKRNTWFISHVITVLIWLLLFLLGIEVGSNPHIVNGIQTLGIEALLLTIGGAIGTILLSWLLWKYVSRKEASKWKAVLSSLPFSS